MNNCKDCKDCKGTGVYVGLFENGPCLTCCGGHERKIVEDKSTMLELPNGAKVWVMNPEELDINNFDWGKATFHRENDKPAIEWLDGSKEWYKEGKIHRESDLPAIERSNGSKYWYKEGKRHRDNDKPAIIWNDGTKRYWVNGRFVK